MVLAKLRKPNKQTLKTEDVMTSSVLRACGESFQKAADKVVKMTIAKALKDGVNG